MSHANTTPTPLQARDTRPERASVASDIIARPYDPALTQSRHEAVLDLMAINAQSSWAIMPQRHPLYVALRCQDIRVLREITDAIAASSIPLPASSHLKGFWSIWPEAYHREIWMRAESLIPADKRNLLTGAGHEALRQSPQHAGPLFVRPTCPIPLRGHIWTWSDVLNATPKEHLADAYWARVDAEVQDTEVLVRVLAQIANAPHAHCFLVLLRRHPHALHHLPALVEGLNALSPEPHSLEHHLAARLASAHGRLQFLHNMRAHFATSSPSNSPDKSTRILMRALGIPEGFKGLRAARKEDRQRARGRTPGPKGGAFHPSRRA